MKRCFMVHGLLNCFVIAVSIFMFLPPVLSNGDDIYTEAALPNEHLRLPDTALSVGSSRYSFPIELPPGRNAMTPELSLDYSSSGGNGLLGVGWELNTGYIRCSVKDGFTCRSFEVMANGQISELAPRTEWNANYWGAVIENAFTQYIEPGSADDGWMAITREGLVYSYGGSANSRVGDHKWLLDKIQDPNGNYITYTYNTDDGFQKRLVKIAYTGNSNTGSAPFASVTFSYQTRNDVFIDYLAKRGGAVKHRLSAITTKLNNQRVRRYELDYGAYAADTGRSIIRGIHPFGADNTQTLPSYSLTYNSGGKGTYTESGTISLPHNSNLAHVRYHDLNGDGICDIYQDTGTSIKIYYINKNGAVYQTTSKSKSRNSDIFFVEINGDGHADLIRKSYGVFYPSINDGSGGFDDKDSKTLWNSSTYSGIAISAAYTDIDGDGRSEVMITDIQSSTEVDIYGYDVSETGDFTRSSFQMTLRPEQYCHIFSDTFKLQFADINGDHRSDIIASWKGKSDDGNHEEIHHHFQIYAAREDGAFELM